LHDAYLAEREYGKDVMDKFWKFGGRVGGRARVRLPVVQLPPRHDVTRDFLEKSTMNGRTLGHYEIVGKLGEGGKGEVYRALDTRLDRIVALKVLSDQPGG
jgi:serine/threonine protein kinase